MTSLSTPMKRVELVTRSFHRHMMRTISDRPQQRQPLSPNTFNPKRNFVAPGWLSPQTYSYPYKSSCSKRSFVTVTKTSPSDIVVQHSSNSGENGTAGSNIASSAVQQDNTSIIITASAVQQINHLANLKRPQEPEQMYLRVYVDAGGCSGFQYKFDIENRDDEDAIDEEEDILIHCVANANSDLEKVEAYVVVDEASLELLQGSTIDFVREMIRSSFAVVSNPQSESACGCGSSFAVKNFEKHGALD